MPILRNPKNPCPQCRHPEFNAGTAGDGRPDFICLKCRYSWTCGDDGAGYLKNARRVSMKSRKVPKADQIMAGGLMRCCIGSLLKDKKYGKGREGDRVSCRYCEDTGMVFREGAWRWDIPADERSKTGKEA